MLVPVSQKAGVCLWPQRRVYVTVAALAAEKYPPDPGELLNLLVHGWRGAGAAAGGLRAPRDVK